MSKKTSPIVLENEDGSKTIKLLEPIKYGEDFFEEFKFIKPKAKHLKKMRLDRMEMSDILVLGGKLCGQPPSVMDELGMDDLFALVGVVSDFLPDMEGVGKTA